MEAWHSVEPTLLTKAALDLAKQLSNQAPEHAVDIWGFISKHAACRKTQLHALFKLCTLFASITFTQDRYRELRAHLANLLARCHKTATLTDLFRKKQTMDVSHLVHNVAKAANRSGYINEAIELYELLLGGTSGNSKPPSLRLHQITINAEYVVLMHECTQNPRVAMLTTCLHENTYQRSCQLLKTCALQADQTIPLAKTVNHLLVALSSRFPAVHLGALRRRLHELQGTHCDTIRSYIEHRAEQILRGNVFLRLLHQDYYRSLQDNAHIRTCIRHRPPEPTS